MKNTSAWDSLGNESRSEVANSGHSWIEAAEERKNQQKINAGLELQRASQQVKYSFIYFSSIIDL